MMVRMTLLDAVNIVLTVLGQTPVQSITGTTTPDIDAILSILSESSADVQSVRWDFNSEQNYILRKTEAGTIRVPSDIFYVEAYGRHVVVQGDRLYDLERHTYNFDADITADISRFLSFEELPEIAKIYITKLASKRAAVRLGGSATLAGLTDEELATAYGELQRYDNNKYNASMLSNGYNSNTHPWGIPGYNPLDVLRR